MYVVAANISVRNQNLNQKHKDQTNKTETKFQKSYNFLSDIKSESKYPRVPETPKSDISLFKITTRKTLQNTHESSSINATEKRQRYQNLFLYIETTADPSQVIPFHASPHGSPPPVFQLVNCEGLFSEVYKTWRAWTAI